MVGGREKKLVYQLMFGAVLQVENAVEPSWADRTDCSLLTFGRLIAPNYVPVFTISEVNSHQPSASSCDAAQYKA